MMQQTPVYMQMYDQGTEVAALPGIRVVAGRYQQSGVQYLQVNNERGSFRLLPYRGHQIWDAQFDDKPIGMESITKFPGAFEPSSVPLERQAQYLGDYGALLNHCGPNRMGCPDPGADYPLHGVLPLLNFNDASVTVVEKSGIAYAIITATSDEPMTKGKGYDFTVVAQTVIAADSALIHTTTATINNHPHPMDIMELKHVNHRQVPGSTIVYVPTCGSFKRREKDPEHITPANYTTDELDKYRRVSVMFRDHPEFHKNIGNVCFPEQVFYGRQTGTGIAHAMQVRPDFSADVTVYNLSQLPQMIIWMRNATVAQAEREKFAPTNSLGIIPATGLPQGYIDALAAGEVQQLASGDTRKTVCSVGLLNEAELRARFPTIDRLVG